MIIGLTAPKELLRERINQRVDNTLNECEKEIKNIISIGVISSQAKTAICFPAWKDYFDGKKTKEDVARYWKEKDWQYAKRQLTWFKKEKNINWFDVSNLSTQHEVEKLVSTWYN